MSEARLKIAVFIDFDNIEIGVKTTLNTRLDVGAVLEGIKERGEIVTKIAYGDWTRAGDYSREMSQHAINMVQRTLTPGGDKNGADINLALDALEMAFTHSHINAFVIVSGDSDFMALVEKLKQYDRKVLVVGGRQFTSVILQKNCHEFIAYENLIGASGRRLPERGRAAGFGEAPLEKAMPLVRRALKVLADREVSPQIGLLKSTLLQLDSTFSEREYGASSFRDFVQRLAKAGYVNLKGTDRSFHVELKDGDGVAPPSPADTRAPAPPPAITETAPPAAEIDAPADVEPAPEPTAEAAAPAPAGQPADAIRFIHDVFLRRAGNTRWPLYVRQVKGFLRAEDENFDERRYGFAGIIDALRSCQREGIFRLERDRQGVMRVFPGPALSGRAAAEAAAAERTRAEAQPEAVAATPEAEPIAIEPEALEVEPPVSSIEPEVIATEQAADAVEEQADVSETADVVNGEVLAASHEAQAPAENLGTDASADGTREAAATESERTTTGRRKRTTTSSRGARKTAGTRKTARKTEGTTRTRTRKKAAE